MIRRVIKTNDAYALIDACMRLHDMGYGRMLRLTLSRYTKLGLVGTRSERSAEGSISTPPSPYEAAIMSAGDEHPYFRGVSHRYSFAYVARHVAESVSELQVELPTTTLLLVGGDRFHAPSRRSRRHGRRRVFRFPSVLYEHLLGCRTYSYYIRSHLIGTFICHLRLWDGYLVFSSRASPSAPPHACPPIRCH